MGIVKKLMTGAAALSLVAVPVAAQAANAAKLSLSQDVRAGKSTKSTEKQMEGGFIIPLIAVVAVVLGIIAIADSDDSPKSP